MLNKFGDGSYFKTCKKDFIFIDIFPNNDGKKHILDSWILYRVDSLKILRNTMNSSVTGYLILTFSRTPDSQKLLRNLWVAPNSL